MKRSIIFVLITFSIFSSLAYKKKETTDNNKPYRIEGIITIDGKTRTYLINLPPNYNEGKDFSLVIAMHGGGGNRVQFERSSLLTEKANQSKFIVVYPNGLAGSSGLLAKQTWNAGGCCGYALLNKIDDVAFISQLIDKLTSSYKINPKKVYATGHSNGGMMAYRLACELPNKIAAIAPNACTSLTMQPCIASRAVPILHMHSLLDLNVPINGGQSIGPAKIYYPSVLSGLRKWAKINNCSATQPTVVNKGNYTLTQWTDCNNKSSIQYYITKDGGHSWPGGLRGRFSGDEPSIVLNINDLMWDFFQQYQLP